MKTTLPEILKTINAALHSCEALKNRLERVHDTAPDGSPLREAAGADSDVAAKAVDALVIASLALERARVLRAACFRLEGACAALVDEVSSSLEAGLHEGDEERRGWCEAHADEAAEAIGEAAAAREAFARMTLE